MVRAFNTTRMIDRIAAKYGRKVHECPIGFKYIVDLMLKGNILIGGEESGGIGITRHLPERDGLLNSLLLANIMADEGKPFGHLVQDLNRNTGEHHYGRSDLHLSDEAKDDAMRRAGSNPANNRQLQCLEDRDARRREVFPRCFDQRQGAEAWVLVRSSGTEPLLRIYCEAASSQLVAQILARPRLSFAPAAVLEPDVAGRCTPCRMTGDFWHTRSHPEKTRGPTRASKCCAPESNDGERDFAIEEFLNNPALCGSGA